MRLTNEIRNIIISKAMSVAFDAREKAQAKAITILADAVYQHEYGAIEKIANKLPGDWCDDDHHVYIEAAGFHWRGDRDGKVYNGLKMSKSRRVPRYQSNKPIKIGGAHPLNDQAQAVAEEHAALLRDREAMRTKLRAVVYSATTLPKLLEVWPECQKFVPTDLKPAARALVPVELVTELNSALGLKPVRK